MFFIDLLFDTIRVDIGGCIEKAYLRISEAEAARLLFFNNASNSSLLDYAKSRNWVLNGKREFTFSHKNNDNGAGMNKKIEAQKIALQVLDYAHELEMIV